MSALRAMISPDGRVAVDIEMPVGKQCDDTDAEMRAILEIFGAGYEDVVEKPNAPRQPNGIPEGTRNKQGM